MSNTSGRNLGGTQPQAAHLIIFEVKIMYKNELTDTQNLISDTRDVFQ